MGKEREDESVPIVGVRPTSQKGGGGGGSGGEYVAEVRRD